MYRLGARSKERLAGVHPDLARTVALAITLTTQDFTVLEGRRTIATQREYVRKGASQTMNSRHLAGPDGYGRAVDLAAWVAGGIRWEWPLYLPIAEAMRKAGRQLGIPLRYGGGWYHITDLESMAAIKRATDDYVTRRRAQRQKAFLDGPHFELPRSARYP